ncbi:unnamed protein product, partial [Polarella glacialis]
RLETFRFRRNPSATCQTLLAQPSLKHPRVVVVVVAAVAVVKPAVTAMTAHCDSRFDSKTAAFAEFGSKLEYLEKPRTVAQIKTDYNGQPMQCQPGSSQAKTAIHDSTQRPHTPSAGLVVVVVVVVAVVVVV